MAWSLDNEVQGQICLTFTVMKSRGLLTQLNNQLSTSGAVFITREGSWVSAGNVENFVWDMRV